jgi:hypothetical protein
LLQDRVSFPRVLDVAPFLAESRAAAAAAAAQAGAPDGGAAFGRGGASILMRGHSAVQSAVGGVGALNYELYAILVQSGGVAGGHYYAYIKSFTNGNFYEFNDSAVRQFFFASYFNANPLLYRAFP